MPNWTGRRTAIAAGLPELTRYTLRQIMATRIRTIPRPPGKSVRHGLAITTQVIGRRGGMSTRDADHLKAACRATDAIMTALDKICAKSLWASGTEAGGRLTVIGPVQANGGEFPRASPTIASPWPRIEQPPMRGDGRRY
jgi:hypothetical protein